MSDWTPPEGWTLTRHEGYHVNHQGVRLDDETRPEHRTAMPDGAVSVAWFDEEQPFYEDKNMKPGPGFGFEGWSPNVTQLPIQDGYVPPAYTLVRDDDPTLGAVKPATVTAI